MKDILYLGSQSASRQKLLKEVQINFIVVPHSSNEQVGRGNMSFADYVMAIAQEKIDTLSLPKSHEIDRKYIHVLTADTLVHIASSEQIFGKPRNREEARKMLLCMHNKEVDVVTGCCLRRYVVHSNQWLLDKESTWATSALIEFCVEEKAFDIFCETEPDVLVVAGAAFIEGYGKLFFKRINGSHSTVTGLPLFELRQELEKMNFVF